MHASRLTALLSLLLLSSRLRLISLPRPCTQLQRSHALTSIGHSPTGNLSHLSCLTPTIAIVHSISIPSPHWILRGLLGNTTTTNGTPSRNSFICRRPTQRSHFDSRRFINLPLLLHHPPISSHDTLFVGFFRSATLLPTFINTKIGRLNLI